MTSPSSVRLGPSESDDANRWVRAGCRQPGGEAEWRGSAEVGRPGPAIRSPWQPVRGRTVRKLRRGGSVGRSRVPRVRWPWRLDPFGRSWQTGATDPIPVAASASALSQCGGSCGAAQPAVDRPRGSHPRPGPVPGPNALRTERSSQESSDRGATGCGSSEPSQPCGERPWGWCLYGGGRITRGGAELGRWARAAARL